MARKFLSRLSLLVSLLAGISGGGCEQITPQEVARELNTKTPIVQEVQPVSPSATTILTPTVSQTSTLTSTPPATATSEPTEDLMRTALIEFTRIKDDINGDGEINQEDAFLRIKEYRPLSRLTSNEPGPYDFELMEVGANGKTATRNVNFESAYRVQINGHQVPIIVYNGEYFILPIGGGGYPALPTPTNTPTSIPTLDVRSYVEGLGYTLYGEGEWEVLGGLGLNVSLSEMSREIVSKDGLTATLNSRIATVEGSLGSYTLNLYIDSEGGLYGPVVHEVESGETLGRIAGDYGVNLKILKEVNPQIKDPNNIKVGQGIVIPVDGVEVLEYTLPTPTAIPPTPKPRCDCNPDNIVVFYTGDLETSGNKRVERLRQACIDAGINAYVIDHPDKIGSLSIQGVTDIVLVGHDNHLRGYNLGRFSDLAPRATYIDTCYASRFGNPANTSFIFYSSHDNTGTGTALVNHLARVIRGERQIDSNRDGRVNNSELLSSYRNLTVIDSKGREFTIGSLNNPIYIGPDICLLCAP